MTAKRLQFPCNFEFTEKGSRFIGRSYPTETLSEFERHLQALSIEYRDASHIAYAYKIIDPNGTHIRTADAGEPSGTAGRPILNHIEGRKLCQISVFVIRYFGGTKLGAGGLVRAYGQAAKGSLPDTALIEHTPQSTLSLQVSYAEKQHFEYQIRQFNAEILQVSFSERVHYQIRIGSDQSDEFLSSITADLV